ncbi:hypothetical protein CP971_07815 [Streptomyces viridifaciens]|nr:hypothetical protein CP971_07815 [Streptomyces viridifaciens]
MRAEVRPHRRAGCRGADPPSRYCATASRQVWRRRPNAAAGRGSCGPGISHGPTGWAAFRASLEHDFLHAGGFLVIGGMTAATLNVAVPRDLLKGLAGLPGVDVLALAVLAVLLAVCSEADAFVAAGLTSFSTTAKLAFMVVGPMVDAKLIALQAGTFGRAFAWRFSATTFVVAVTAATLTGWWLL